MQRKLRLTIVLVLGIILVGAGLFFSWQRWNKGSNGPLGNDTRNPGAGSIDGIEFPPVAGSDRSGELPPMTTPIPTEIPVAPSLLPDTTPPTLP